MYTSKECEFLKKIGVKYILNAAHNLDNLFPTHFTYHNVAVQDQVWEAFSRLTVKNGTNIQRYFADSNKFLEKARSESAIVLVHCRGGERLLQLSDSSKVSAALHR